MPFLIIPHFCAAGSLSWWSKPDTGVCSSNLFHIFPNCKFTVNTELEETTAAYSLVYSSRWNWNYWPGIVAHTCDPNTLGGGRIAWGQEFQTSWCKTCLYYKQKRNWGTGRQRSWGEALSLPQRKQGRCSLTWDGRISAQGFKVTGSYDHPTALQTGWQNKTLSL